MVSLVEHGRFADVIMVGKEQYKIWLEAAKPSVHALYSACWKAGYTVNGVKP